MNVRLKLFAVAREIVGCDVVDVTLPERATLGQLRQALAAQVPRLAGVASHALFAIGAEYADDGATISEGAEVACIPPVSGG